MIVDNLTKEDKVCNSDEGDSGSFMDRSIILTIFRAAKKVELMSYCMCIIKDMNSFFITV